MCRPRCSLKPRLGLFSWVNERLSVSQLANIRLNLGNKKPALGAGFSTNIGTDYTRFLNSPVRVSISILSPSLTKSATITVSSELTSLAGFITLPVVSPRAAGSV